MILTLWAHRFPHLPLNLEFYQNSRDLIRTIFSSSNRALVWVPSCWVHGGHAKMGYRPPNSLKPEANVKEKKTPWAQKNLSASWDYRQRWTCKSGNGLFPNSPLYSKKQAFGMNKRIFKILRKTHIQIAFFSFFYNFYYRFFVCFLFFFKLN